ncbi:hypothetical protein [Rhodopirellula europaea]|uniref:hypothetical protein n=1 Tax=Rhodopirellula europaea TaxID=1263866 RepID=UPI0030ED666F
MSTTITSRPFSHRIPSAIESKLRRIRLRHATLIIVSAFAFSIGVLLLLMTPSMLIDWMFPFASPLLRITLTGITVVATFATAAYWLIGPLRRSWQWLRAANAVDDNVPELEERWSTVASLSTQDRSTMSTTQRAMANQVTSEAVAMERMVQPRRIAPPIKLRPGMLLAASGIVLFAIVFAISPSRVSVLLKRFWFPTHNITATQLASLTGEPFVPRGDSIELVTRASGVVPSSATISVMQADGQIEDYRLTADEASSDTWSHKMRVDEDVSYRVRAGDAQTEWLHLQTIDFPEIDRIEFGVEFPAYTKRAPILLDRLPRRVKVPQDSVLRLAIKPLDSLKKLTISLTDPESPTPETTASDDGATLPGGSPVGMDLRELSPEEDGWYRMELSLIDDVLLRPTLLSPHDLTNQRRLFSRIDVIEDKAPVARVITPNDETAVAEDEIIEIKFEAHDDHGIGKAELVIYDESQRDADGNAKVLHVQPIPLGDQANQKHLIAQTKLDLKELGLTEGQEISYSIRVTDNKPHADAMASKPDGQNAEKGSPKGDSPKDDSRKSESKAKSNQQQRPGTNRENNDSQSDDSKKSDSQSSDSKPAESKQADSSKSGSNKSNSEPADTKSNDTKSNDTKSNDTKSNDSKPSDSKPSDSKPSDSKPTEDTNPDLKLADTAPANQDESSKDIGDLTTEGDSKPAPMDTADRSMPAQSDNNSQNIKAEPSDAEPSAKPVPNAIAAATPKSQPNATKPNPQGNPTTPSGNPPKDSPGANKSGGKKSDAKKMVQADSPKAKPQPKVANTSKPQAKTPPKKMEPNKSTVSLKATPRRQRNQKGQNATTNRRRLKITEKLAAIAEAEERPGDELKMRESVVEIDQMLAEIETGLRKLVDRKIADSDRSEQFRRLDSGLGNIEDFVAKLREQTRESQYAFVGLQMVDITRSHVTPARDRAFAGSQRASSDNADATMSLQHVVRARELLGALLKRFDRVKREKKLKKEMDEAVTIYEVYLEKRRQLMREARQNRNPLDRKMGIVEVDQAYLDRLAEVLELRRAMMDEFAEMLGDDPRLLSRYMELVQRRQKSLRNQLSDLSQRQYDLTEEAMNWLQIDPSQRPDLWTIIIELRLSASEDLAKDAAQLAERVQKQLPLEVNAESGTAANLVRTAKQISATARNIQFEADELDANSNGEAKDHESTTGARSLIDQCERLFSHLDRLQFENEGNDALALYVESRIQETRVVADQADVWADLHRNIQSNNYGGLVQTEQYRLAISTQLLRVEMLDMEPNLTAEFLRTVGSDLPGEIKDMIRTLHRLMETITYNQIAASIRSGQVDLESGNAQQQLATDRLTEAEELFDKIRRSVVMHLDEYDPQDPNIADLRDPTLDEFLARLEREPNIASQLGIPNRRTNLRIRADTVLWQESASGGTLEGSQMAAARRAAQAMKMQKPKPKNRKPKGGDKRSEEMSEEEREQAKRAQEMLAKTLLDIEKQKEDGEQSAAERQRLDEMAEKIKRLMDQDGDGSAERAWQQIVQADEAKELMQAIANGEFIADQQWNRLLSTLDDGLWQVQGNRPPEAYRKAIEQYQDQLRELMSTIDEG